MAAHTPPTVAQTLAELDEELDTARNLRLEAEGKHKEREEREAENQLVPVRIHTHKRI